MGERFLDDFYGVLANDLKLVRALPVDLPAGVTAQRRSDGERDFIFVMNFTEQPQCVNLPVDGAFTDMMTGEAVSGALTLEGFGVRVIQGKASQ
jgi:beta-galactosidase